MVRGPIAAQLGKQGFRRQRNRFGRLHAGGWQIIDFQASQFGSRDDVRFTVNLGVAYPELRGADDTWTEKHAPAEHKAHVRERIGFLLAGGEDHWWELTPDTDPRELADELIGVLSTKALPWLEARADFAQYLDMLHDRRSELGAHELARLPKLLEDVGERDLAACLLAEQDRRRR